MRTGFELVAGNIMVAAAKENVSFAFTARAMTGLHWGKNRRQGLLRINGGTRDSGGKPFMPQKPLPQELPTVGDTTLSLCQYLFCTCNKRNFYSFHKTGKYRN